MCNRPGSQVGKERAWRRAAAGRPVYLMLRSGALRYILVGTEYMMYLQNPLRRFVPNTPTTSDFTASFALSQFSKQLVGHGSHCLSYLLAMEDNEKGPMERRMQSFSARKRASSLGFASLLVASAP